MEENTRALFHTQLSSIMEKLVLSAVTEINQLLCDYCAVLRGERSGDRQQSPGHVACLELLGQLQHNQMQSHKLWRNEDKIAEEQEEETLMLADCKFEPVLIKQNEKVPEDESEMKECPQHQDAAGPSEVREGLHTDCKQSVEKENLFSTSPIGNGCQTDACHIKRGAESRERIDQSFEIKMFTDSGALPIGGRTLPDTPALTCYSSSHLSGNTPRIVDICDLSSHGQHTSDGDTSSYQGNQFNSEGGSRDIAVFGVGRSANGHSHYMCDYCEKDFPFLSTMKRHRLMHTGERTQVCKQCGMSFIRRSHLRRHELLHSGVRPFTCQICGRKFSRSAHLNTHMKTHWG